MEKIFAKGGYEYVSAKIAEAIADGSRTATITGNWEIDHEVLLPSDFTLIIEDCHLRLADGCFANVFVNEKLGAASQGHSGADKNIAIIGRGNAILDGGKPNGLNERTRSNYAEPIWKNNLIRFANVDGFKITGLSCRNQRWWALNFLFASNGYIADIDFCANDTGIDENGNEYHGLVRDKYEEVLVKNADGIDLRLGCHDVVIENITGFTEDDMIALTGLMGDVERAHFVDGLSTDIANVTIRNVRGGAFCTLVRLLNQGDVKLHDVYIDGVYDMGLESPHMDHGLYAVRVGDTRLYGRRHATADETYNVTIKNVVGAGDYVISLAGSMKNVTLEKIEAVGDTVLMLDERV